MAVPSDLSDVVQYLNAVSAIAVLLGVVFVVFQLRQNARLIEVSNKQAQASIQQNKSNAAFSIVDRFTDDSFTMRRKTVRDVVKKYSSTNWEGFLQTSEDFDVRAFGSYYEYTAYLARTNIIDLETLKEVLGHRLTFDWEAFAPAVEYYRRTWGKKFIFTNFEWLAKVTGKYLEEKERRLG